MQFSEILRFQQDGAIYPKPTEIYVKEMLEEVWPHADVLVNYQLTPFSNQIHFFISFFFFYSLFNVDTNLSFCKITIAP